MLQKLLISITGSFASVTALAFHTSEAMDLSRHPQYTSYDNQLKTTNSRLQNLLTPSAQQILYPESGLNSPPIYQLPVNSDNRSGRIPAQTGNKESNTQNEKPSLNNSNSGGQDGRGSGSGSSSPGGGDDNNDDTDQQADRDAPPLLLESVFEAAAKGEAHPVLDYLQQGGSVDIRDDSNRTLLHVAVANGHLHIAKIVLRFGANIDDVMDNDKKTPLDHAVAQGFDFLRRFLALAYGEFNLKGRWQSVRHHIRVDPKNSATSALRTAHYSPTVVRYRKTHHQTTRLFQKSFDFQLFTRQFKNNIAHLEQLTKTLFGKKQGRELVTNLQTFSDRVLENEGSFFSTRIDLAYGEIHEDICTIVDHLKTLPEQAQRNALEQLLSDIDVCIDGVFTRTQQTLFYINTQTTTEARLTEAYRHLLEAAVIEQLNEVHSGYFHANEIHYINAYLNYLSESPIRHTDSAHWPNIQRHDLVSQSLGITATQLEGFAEKAAARVHAAEVIEWLTEQSLGDLQEILPQNWLSSPLQPDLLTSERLEALNLWFDRLKTIVPDDLTLWDLVEEAEEGYDLSALPLQLKRAIARYLSGKLYPPLQPDVSTGIQTCNDLVYWINGEEMAQPVTFADFQSLLESETTPICDQLVLEVIRSTSIFSQLLHLLIHVLPENRPDISRRLLNAWYAHTLSNQKTREPFERLVSTARNELLQKIGLPDHFGVHYHENWIGHELLKRMSGEQVEWDQATALKNRLLQDPDLLTTELIKETEQLSLQQQERLLLSLVTQGKADLLQCFPYLNPATISRLSDSNVSLLRNAARIGHTETVALLLERGADIDANNPSNGWHALGLAAINGYTDVVALLLDAGSDIHYTNPVYGWNSLGTAAMNGRTDVAVLLLNRGADINHVNPKQGWNAVTAAACNGCTDTIKLLLDRGADIHFVNPKSGWNALTISAHNGHADTVKLLLDLGADIHSVNQKTGSNTLIIAVNKGNTETVELLLDRGADIHSVNQKTGYNALITATCNGHTKTVELLLDRGADIHSINQKAGCNALISAADADHADIVMLLLDRGADIHSVTKTGGWSALTQAACNGFNGILALLLDRGANIHSSNPISGWNALTAAANNGHSDSVAMLLDRGADIHFIIPQSGWNALTTAVRNGCTDTAKVLLDRGADIHSVNPVNGFNALTIAAHNGHTDTVKMLLDRGADIHYINPVNGLTALTAAAQNGHTNTVGLLVNRGAHIHSINPIHSSNALITAASNGHTNTVAQLLNRAHIHSINPVNGINALFAAARNGHTDTVALLLDRGADIHFINQEDGWNALACAARNDNTDTVALLLNRGADIHFTTLKGGWNPLTLAAVNGNSNTVALLLDRGADIHSINQNQGWNALTGAAREGHTATVSLLLDRGADINFINPKNGQSALTAAASAGHTDTAALLLDRGADINFTIPKHGHNALTAAASEGHTDTAALLLDRGADINFVNRENGHSALTTAASSGHTDIAALLLDRGADIHFINQKDGWCALTAAAGLGHTDTAALLLDRGADIHMDNPFSCDQALKIAAESGHTSVVELLLNKGANIDYISDNFNGTDNDGRNALMIAAQNGHKEIVTLLVNSGSDINLPNPLNGWTALTYAGSGGHSEIAKILIEAGTAASWRKWLLKLLF